MTAGAVVLIGFIRWFWNRFSMATITTTETREHSLKTRGFVTVSSQNLIIGRKLEAPLFDTNGILLLAAGSVITYEIKLAIANRGNRSVCLSQRDAERVTLQQESLAAIPPVTAIETDLTRKIDAIIDAGLFTVQNHGPLVKEEVAILGRQAYNLEQHQRLVRQRLESSQTLNSLMNNALRGVPIDGQIVSSIAIEHLQEMTTDIDHVLGIAMQRFQQNDDFTGRSLEVALLAMAIGIEMDLDAKNIRHLAIAGLVHDWGMMLVPEEIRNASHRLNPREMLEIKKHPIYSLELLQQVSSLPSIVSVVAYQVHERFNGTGFPRGRCGHSIHPFARILQVADVFVGMTSPRPYRPPMMRYAAMEGLIRQAKERAVDPEVVRALLRVQSLFPIGSYVALSDGSVAQVLRRNRDYYTEPIVMRIQDCEGNPLPPDDEGNIIDLHEAKHLQVVQALAKPGSEETTLSEDLYQFSLAGNN